MDMVPTELEPPNHWPAEVVETAVALKRELDKPPAPPPLPALSLYKIESAIFQLLDALDEAEADQDHEAVQAMLLELSRYTAAEPAKVDGVCYSIRECERRGEVAKAEADRLYGMAKRWEARATRIKESALHAMLDHGVKSVESATNWMRPQRNSSARLDVYDANAVPNDLKHVTLNLTWAEWVKLETALEACELGDWLGGLRVRRKMEVDGDRVREALEVLVQCGECLGSGRISMNHPGDQPPTCTVCGGKGTVMATVPGARLLERGFHLRLSRPPKEELTVKGE